MCLGEHCSWSYDLRVSFNKSLDFDSPSWGSLFKVSANSNQPMAPTDLASLKWEDDGELSSQDTFNLVQRLTRTEEDQKASDLLHLSSKHSHAKKKNKSLTSRSEVDIQAH